MMSAKFQFLDPSVRSQERATADRIQKRVSMVPFRLPLVPSSQHLRFLDGLAHGKANDKPAPLVDFAFCR